MFRPIRLGLGLLLVFAVPATLNHNNAVAATKQKVRKASGQRHDPAPSRDSLKRSPSGAQKRSAVKAGSRKKPAEVKLKPVQPLAESPAPSATASTTGSSPPSRGPTRIDFDDRLVQGQTNRSGAVYLYDRKELRTPSMIKKRESFREEILATVYGN